MTGEPVKNGIFISWSGEHSWAVADLLRSWLPYVLDGVGFWMSSRDIPDGTRWLLNLLNTLEYSRCGILILTPENRNSPWILFEAGVLLRNVQEGRVIPYLVSMNTDDLQGPLSQFQALKADKAGTLRLVKAIGEIRNDTSQEVLSARFEKFWPKFSDGLQSIKSKYKSNQPEEITSFRWSTENHMVEDLRIEVKSLSRLIHHLVSELHLETTDSSVSSNETVKLMELEGVWVDSLNGTHLYARVIKDELFAPYCYRGNSHLTGVYFGWRLVGDYWYARFHGFAGFPNGFSFFTHNLKDVIDGMWWTYDFIYTPDTPIVPPMPHEEGVKTKYERRYNLDFPNWASEYLNKLERQVSEGQKMIFE